MQEEEQVQKLEEALQEVIAELRATQGKVLLLQQQVQQLQKGKKSRLSLPTSKHKEPVTVENFIGLRLIHVVGIVVLVIGLSIGVKYAIDKDLISAAARIGLAYAAGAVLYLLSLRLKTKYAAFSAILFSGAMASLYFTTYAAFVYYQMFTSGITFLIMILLTLYTAYEALRYNRQEIAVLGLVGAYAIPFLISQNSGRADLFFLYITIINSAVVFLGYKKGWRAVTYLAQLATWILFYGWLSTKYEAQQQWLAVSAGSVFFLLFIFSAIARRLLQGEIFTFRQVQQILLNDIVFYITALFVFAPSLDNAPVARVSIGFAAFFAVQALLLHFLFATEFYIKKMVSLLSLTLFLVFIACTWDGIIVTLLWLLTSVALFVWGVSVKAVWLRMSAIVLMGVTLLKLATVDSLRFSTIQKIIAYISLGILLLVISFFYQKFKHALFEEKEN